MSEQDSTPRAVAEPIPPLETGQQARGLPQVRAVYEKISEGPLRPGSLAGHNMRMLQDAVNAAGVRLGAYDLRILQWLAGWEPETCGVVASLITRAAEGRQP